MKKITLFCLSLFVALAVSADEWTLVTDASTLQAGDQIVLAYSADNATAGTTISTNGSKSAYWIEPVSASFGSNTLTPAGNTAIFTLGQGATGAWTLTNQYGQLLGVTAVKKLAWDSGTTTWNISSGSVVSSTNESCGQICYNTNQTRFTTYNNPSGSTIKAIQIYKGASAAKYELTYQGFPYRRTACEIPTYTEGSSVTLSSARPMKDGQTLRAWQYEGVEYLPGATFVMPNKNAELVPVWGEATAIENTSVNAKPIKVFRNGQLLIIKDNMMYNVLGERIQ